MKNELKKAEITEADCIRLQCMIWLHLSKVKNWAPSPSSLDSAMLSFCFCDKFLSKIEL